MVNYNSRKELARAGKLIHTFFSIKIIRIILALVVIIIVAPYIYFLSHRPQIQTNINYGTTFSKKYAEQLGLDWKYTYTKILDDLKIKNLRLVAYWDDIEKTPRDYNFQDIEWQLDEAQKRNVNVIMTIGRKVPRYPECFEPAWWKSTTSEEERDLALYRYINKTTTTLKRYNNIKMWQVENEPFFPFGDCKEAKVDVIKREIAIVKSIDSRPILIQDSGEGGIWVVNYKLGDYLGISVYRKTWFDLWGLLLGKFVYFQYPLADWTYKIKADILGVPVSKIIVTELQGEPWGPEINSALSQEEIDKTMSKNQFLSVIDYGQKTGFKDLYFWGAEWWLFEKETKGNSFYWNTAKAVVKP